MFNIHKHTFFSPGKAASLPKTSAEKSLKAYPITIDITPLDQWTFYGAPYIAYKFRPSGIESYYDQTGKRQRCPVQDFPCTVYLQPNDPPNTPSAILSGIIAVLFWTGSATTTGIAVTASRGTVTLAKITGNTVAVYWSGKKTDDPVMITIREAQETEKLKHDS